MNYYSLLKIGDFHLNHCEDFYVIEPVSAHIKMVAVMDGCTMGKESAFASMLYGKILRQIAKKMYYEDFLPEETVAPSIREILKNLLNEAQKVRAILGLEKAELLSTLLLGLIDERTNSAELIVIGDGAVYHDGQLTEFDQGNTPDYLAYHFHEDFDTWYSSLHQHLYIEKFSDLSICSDGLFTFRSLKQSSDTALIQKAINYLLVDATYQKKPNMLERNLREMEKNLNGRFTDDIAIVRVLKVD